MSVILKVNTDTMPFCTYKEGVLLYSLKIKNDKGIPVLFEFLIQVLEVDRA